MWGFSSNPKKCANASCTCLAPEKKKYCSDHCEKIGNRMEVICLCDHADCNVSSLQSSGKPEYEARGPAARL